MAPAADVPPATRKPNHLIHEKSPYLLQHAYNPVDWYPWSKEAFEKAAKEDKPIFLSIGYSSCHWCHVMEAESYSNDDVARVLNNGFISIKVDREERPDIDNVYMSASEMMTGGGGWPLNIVMTPDKKPFFAGTYIPRDQLIQLLTKINQIWKQNRSDLLNSAGKITALLQPVAPQTASSQPGTPMLDAAFKALSDQFDEKNGGFGKAPKFPSPHQLMFLLRYWKRTGNQKALHMATTTLDRMRAGGIYDHIGFGFHRYSTDARWLAPHFEKMLYDQAMLALAYTEAYQATRQELYRQTASDIFKYISRVMTSPDGVFYTAEDADSEGKEGQFYLWKESEIRKLLSKEDADLVVKVFGVTSNGNFEGQNILHMEQPVQEKLITTRLESARAKLFAAREKRIHPFKDDKVLTDWNGLMIAALARAGQVFGDTSYLKTAERAADFLLNKMRKPDGQLLHRYRDGEASVQGTLDDYAFLTWGLLELYEGTFDTRYLKAAIEIEKTMDSHFSDTTNGGFYFTADNSENLLVRSRELYDGASPSGNSVAALNLLRLSRITADTAFEQKASQMERVFAKTVQDYPAGYTQFLQAVDYSEGPSYEVVIAGQSDAKDTRALLDALQSRFVPNKVVLLRPTEQETPEIVKLAEFTKYHTALHGKATAYVCRNFACKAPTTSAERMLQLLQ